jgi:signal transduction histidine kinase
VSRISLRVRLASLIGLMLVVSGAALLAISYGLVSSNLSTPLSPTAPPGEHMVPAQPGGAATPRRSTTFVQPVPATVRAAETRTQSALRARTLNQLVTQYLLAGAGIVLVAIALGWFLAGRLLGSLRRITSVAQRITGRNLDERIGLNGPRDELRELAEAFDQMLARLDGVFTAQRRFVADASHELRTPLAAMRTEIEVLAADPDAAVADMEAATLVLRRQFARSEALIGSLLALARSEPGLLAREFVDLADVASEAREDAGIDADSRRLRVDADLTPALVEGDRRLLTLLAANVLSNAVKHNHDRGWVTLSTRVDSGVALLDVANSGLIVTAEEVQELTQAFRRGGTARVGDGHGLGLAIAAAVTSAHNGTLTIGHRTEGGLRVEVRLPLANPQPADARTTTTQGVTDRLPSDHASAGAN